MTNMTCACNEPLTRRLYPAQIECAACGFFIPARTIRYMCLKPECRFHVCNTCKGQAQSEDQDKGDGREDQMGTGVEGHKRGGLTP
eukprot:12054224-Karenia_brevis.AAC.1